jgi:polyhydroxybutyrate depolymerase
MPRVRRTLAAVLGLAAALLIAVAPARAQAGAEVRHTLSAGGVERGYVLYLPRGYQRTRPVPLVLVLHGGGGRARGMARHTGFSDLAEREGFAVVYPEGLGRRWNDGRGWGSAHDDVGFVRLLLDTLSRTVAIDPRRVYATGISNGAMFAHRLACDLPGVFAAIAPVAGALPVALEQRCAGAQPVAVAAFQGTADPLMPYDGGGVARRRGQVLSAARTAEFWARVDGCAGPPESAPASDGVTDGTRVRRERWSGCRDGREVVLYTIEGGGHTWPGGPAVGRSVGRVSRELEATGVIWSFFAEHPRS